MPPSGKTDKAAQRRESRTYPGFDDEWDWLRVQVTPTLGQFPTLFEFQFLHF